MRTRTLANRDWLGGFLCGLIGILLMGLVSDWLAPIGGSLGFVFGFRYESIFSAIAAHWRAAARRAKERWQRFKLIATTPTFKLPKVKVDLSPVVSVLQFFLFLIVWVLRRPVVLYRWLKRHPMNRAYALLGLAVAIYFAIQLLWAVPIVRYIEGQHEISQQIKQASHTVNGGDSSALMIVGALLAFIIALVLPLITVLSPDDDEMIQLRQYYRRYARYANNGAIAFLVQSIIGLLRTELFIILFFFGAIAYFVVGGAMLLVFAFAPVAAIVGLFRGFWRVIKRNDYWPGLIVSLTTMLTVGWLTHPYLYGMMLWVVALATGTLCGGASASARRTLLAYYWARPRLQAMVRLRTSRYLLPSGRRFIGVASWLGKFMGDKVMPVIAPDTV